jgi:adenine-specific DNA methylase
LLLNFKELYPGTKMVKCPICGKRLVPRSELKQVKKGMYAAESKSAVFSMI